MRQPNFIFKFMIKNMILQFQDTTMALLSFMANYQFRLEERVTMANEMDMPLGALEYLTSEVRTLADFADVCYALGLEFKVPQEALDSLKWAADNCHEKSEALVAHVIEQREQAAALEDALRME